MECVVRQIRKFSNRSVGGTILEGDAKMKRKTRTVGSLVACSAVAILTGCATTNRSKLDYGDRIHAAYQNLEKGSFGQAMKDLESATRLAAENGYDQTQIKCLLAEIHLGKGDTLEAYHEAKELIEKDEEDPYANELLGKIYLRQGGFLGAEQYFLTAQAEYEDARDIARAKDLVALAKGLNAYKAGSPRLANRYWGEIQDPSLRYSLDGAQKEMRGPLSNSEWRW